MSKMNLQETIINRITEAGGRLRVKSALNPALWLCAIVSGPVTVIIMVLMLAGKEIPIWLTTIDLIPVVCAAFGFLYLLIFDRDKLQSEDYQIRKKTLELIQEKGDKFPMLGTSIQSIANPESPKTSKLHEEVDE
jgi:hypothetical protein